MDNIGDSIKWDSRGLVPVVVQDHKSRDVVMVAYMNAEALELDATGRGALTIIPVPGTSCG